MIPINRATSIKAHHMPALKIVSTTPQLLSVTKVKRSMKSKGEDVFM
jgi:hypothetical protein